MVASGYFHTQADKLNLQIIYTCTRVPPMVETRKATATAMHPNTTTKRKMGHRNYHLLQIGKLKNAMNIRAHVEVDK